MEGKDYTVLYKENEKGVFRSTTYKTEDVKQVWLSTIVAENENVTINMPTSFEEANLLGMVGWCFCDKEGYWVQHTIPIDQSGYGETIYFIHNILQENPDDYVTDMVKRDGNHEILNRDRHHLNVPRFLKSVGNLARILVPSTREITESKTNKNMKKKTVKINESTLRKIVAESVKKVLSEIINPFDDGFGGVDTAMAASYSNKSIGDAWLKKAGMRRDMLQGGKPVPNNKEENESKINESCSYIRSSVGDIEQIRSSLKDILNHIDSICDGMSHEEYAFGYSDSNSETTDVLRKMWPLVHELGDIWGYRF